MDNISHAVGTVVVGAAAAALAAAIAAAAHHAAATFVPCCCRCPPSAAVAAPAIPSLLRLECRLLHALAVLLAKSDRNICFFQPRLYVPAGKQVKSHSRNEQILNPSLEAVLFECGKTEFCNFRIFVLFNLAFHSIRIDDRYKRDLRSPARRCTGRPPSRPSASDSTTV